MSGSESSFDPFPPVGAPFSRPDRPSGRWLSFRTGVCIVVTLHVVVGLLVYEPVLLANGDNAGYMILAEALRTGEGYRNLHLPGTPVHDKFPPLYPALLALLGWLGGLQLFKLASLGLTAAAVGLTIHLGRRWLSLRGGLLAGAAVAVNPLLLEYSHHVMSEALFTALLMASLYAADRAEGGSSSERAAESPQSSAGSGWWWTALVAGTAAFLTRTVGLALLLGLVLAPVLRARWRRFAAAAATAVAGVGGWAFFQRAAAPGRAGYLREWLMVHPYDPGAGTVGLTGMMERAAVNLWTYVSWLFPSALTGLAQGYSGGGLLAALVGLALSALVLAGWLIRCRSRPGAAEIAVFFYVAILAVWPSLWVDRRFLIPLIPLLVLYLLVGGNGLGQLAAGLAKGELAWSGRADPAVPDTAGGSPLGARRVTTTLLALFLVLFSGTLLAARIPDRVACALQYREGNPCQHPAFESFYDAARWARANTKSSAVFVSAKPRLFYLKSGRRSRIYRYTEDADRMLRDLRTFPADFVVVDALPGIGNTTRRYLLPAVETHRDQFHTVYEAGQPVTHILKITESVDSRR